MTHISKISVVLFICLTFVHKGDLQSYSLRCYTCSSASSEDSTTKNNCRDPFNANGIDLVNCTGLRPKCLKVTGWENIFHRTITERSCVTNAPKDNADCENVVRSDLWVNKCSLCENDGCNKGHPSSLRPHKLQVFLFAMVTSFCVIREYFFSFS